MAAALKAGSATLLAANARDADDARKRKLDEAAIDRLTLTPKTVGMMADGLHPNAAGYRVIAAMWERQILAVTARRATP